MEVSKSVDGRDKRVRETGALLLASGKNPTHFGLSFTWQSYNSIFLTKIHTKIDAQVNQVTRIV